MKKVIVVDDSRTARYQVMSTLAQVGFETVEAVDGRDGITKIEEHPDAQLVLCDINMPELGGLDMLERLAPEVRAKHVFVMLTTEAQPALIKRAKSLGARGWIVKPFKPELLLAAVKKTSG